MGRLLPHVCATSSRRCHNAQRFCASNPWEACMQAQSHPLEAFFQQAVRNSYEGKLGLNDPDVTAYVARLLCEFSQSEKLSQRNSTACATRWAGPSKS